MKYFFSVVFLSISLLCSTCFAQQQYVYLFNKKDQRVSNKDSMDYIMVIKGPSADKLYDVTEYYRSGKLKKTGRSSAIYPPVWEGPSASYWPNGNKQQSSTYIKSQVIGGDSSFFHNGNLHTVVEFTPTDKMLKDSIPEYSSIFIKTCNDSTGKALVVDGNGHMIYYDDDSGAITREGEVKNGRYDGTWKGYTEGVPYTELYKDGILISGVSEKDGKNYYYDANTIEKSPDFLGGIQAFYEYLQRITEYPAADRLKKIKGRVIASFTIDKNGNVISVEILKSPSNDMANETRRVLMLSPSWIPGTERGVAVKKVFTIPISYGL